MTEQEALLLAVQALTDKQAPFKVEDALVFKDHMRNRMLPKYGEVVIVSHVYTEPVFDTTDSSGLPGFNESFDIRIAMLDDDGDLVEMHADSRRYRLAD